MGRRRAYTAITVCTTRPPWLDCKADGREIYGGGECCGQTCDGRVNDLLNQLMLEGVTRQLRVVLQAHLLEDVGPVGADGLDAEGQLLGDL